LKRTSSVSNADEVIDEHGEINPNNGISAPKPKSSNHAQGIRNILATLNSERD